ncbi:DUF2625 family protein [Tenggerimyces flavus]|uniref:DUF2625 family protein n=1 Tax=Tenggerimyces flavus TaxID=1708749 RepID=A0ABV7YEN9_9ACTN|nr:DUF2625 family protein [Tenggerimyces flavus]MBM7787843.1 hypothetical protein [Tenggerimyces flavus]
MDAGAWDEIRTAAQASPYPVELLAADPDRASSCLARLGITTNSWLGAIVAHTGGVLVDHGWLRVLGSGVNGLPEVGSIIDRTLGLLIVGHDVLGGQFAWVPPAAGAPPTIHFFAPDTLSWLDTELGYAAWLDAVFAGSLTQVYDTLRWPGWENEVSALAFDEGIHTYPPPSTVEGEDLSKVSRKAVPIAELCEFHHELARQLR